jgi:hypothetical protein
MLEGPIAQDTDYVEIETDIVYTVLLGTQDGIIDTETVLEVLGTELPAVVYYNQLHSTKSYVCTEAAFRERFKVQHG